MCRAQTVDKRAASASSTCTALLPIRYRGKHANSNLDAALHNQHTAGGRRYERNPVHPVRLGEFGNPAEGG